MHFGMPSMIIIWSRQQITSAMSGDGIETAITDLAKKIINNGGNKGGKYNLRLSESNKNSSKCC